MAFSSWADPEVITVICAGIVSILGGIAAFLKKVKGKTYKEMFQNIHKQDIEEIRKISENAINSIKEVVKEKESKANKPKE